LKFPLLRRGRIILLVKMFKLSISWLLAAGAVERVLVLVAALVDI
jgi:hypothetical protein